MFRTKLKALDYPRLADFDVCEALEVGRLILWLEDQVIRHYRIEDRGGLRAIDDPDAANAALAKFLGDLGCPHPPSAALQVRLDWILAYAVRLLYADNVEEYRQVKAKEADGGSLSKKSRPSTDNPLDELEFSSPEFSGGVTELCDLLQLAPHPDHLLRLKAAAMVVSEHLRPKGRAPSGGGAGELRLADVCADTGDPGLRSAAAVLRLSHLKRLRELQTQINEAIVAVQAITADPKTNQRLGKVGYG